MPRPRTYLLQEVLLILGWAYVVVVAGGITGQINFRIHAASAVAASVVLGGWLVWRLVRGQPIPRSGFELGTVLFIGALLLATVNSIDARRSLSTLSTYVTFLLAFYFWLDLYRAGLAQELVEKSLIIVIAILVGLSLMDAARSILAWRALTLAGTLPFAPPFLFRAYTLLSDANLGAAVTNLTIPLALARAYSGRGVGRVASGLYAGLAMLAVYFTSSRGGWLALAASLVALAVLLLMDNRRVTGPDTGLAWLVAYGRLRLRQLRQRPLFALAVGLVVLAAAGGGGYLLWRQSAGPTHGSIAQSRTVFWRTAWLAFASNPLTGTGLGTYSSAFTRYAGVPPDRPYPHAHSFPFTLLAEAGLNGGVGLIVVLTMMAGAFNRRARGRAASLDTSEPQPSMAGPLAALVGLAVHSLFDNHLLFPSVAIPAAALAAAIFHNPARPRATAHPARRPPGFSPLWLAVPGLAAIAIALYSLRAEATSELALQAVGQGDWRGAAALFDQASTEDPRLALYSLEAGYAYGVQAAEGDPAALETAIARYEAGLRLEPNYSLNHANLGALYLQAGRTKDAQAEFRQAIDLAGEPGSWLYWLNYGAATEQLGDAQAAREAYVSALRLRPMTVQSSFWQANDVRKSALAAWQAESILPSDALARGFSALDAGDLDTAQADFAEGWRENPLRPAVYHGLALVAEQRGEPALVDPYFAAALSMQTAENESKVLPLIAWAEWAAANDQPGLARDRYESAFVAVTSATLSGWGTQGFTPYSWFVFGRAAPSEDLLPQLIRADISPQLAARLLPLGDLRLADGDEAGAVEVYSRLLQLEPALDEARARLDDLDARQN